jgi:hypothetical protein
MAKCKKCSARKGKRPCPALGGEICPTCCGENRLETIPCPRDCPFLQGEFYQHHRRQEQALSRGRDFVALQEKLFRDEAAREFVFRIQADLYYFGRENGPFDDAAAAAALETVKSFLSKVFVPPEGPSPLTRFLLDRLGDGKRYPAGPGLGAEERRRAVGALASHVRSLARDGSRRYFQIIAGFFDALDFEADLDYSPLDAAEGEAVRPAPRKTGSGLILPPGI